MGSHGLKLSKCRQLRPSVTLKGEDDKDAKEVAPARPGKAVCGKANVPAGLLEPRGKRTFLVLRRLRSRMKRVADEARLSPGPWKAFRQRLGLGIQEVFADRRCFQELGS